MFYRMGTDWNQVMAQYGSFLSQHEEQPVGSEHFVLPVDGHAEGTTPPVVAKKPNQRTKLVSHPVLEGKPNANHVRARISNSRTQQLHNWTSSHSAQIII
jgi:hypothetical protein